MAAHCNIYKKVQAMNITHHTQLINHLITRYGLKSYLEIGVQRPENNFDKVNCQLKTGVDPECAWTNEINNVTSDAFFERYYNKTNNRTTFDLIFIDGYHECSQVQRDFNNSLRCLNEGGFIIIHDTCPDEEQYATLERNTRKWFGDVWKFALNLGQYPGISYYTLNIDCGITIVWKDPSEKQKDTTENVYWDYYITHRDYYLNIIPPADIDKYLPDVKATA